VNICWLKFMLALVEDQDEKTLAALRHEDIDVPLRRSPGWTELDTSQRAP